MEIYPDPYLVPLFLPPFLVAIFAMWFILWKPLLAWMDERDEASAHARSEAKRLDADSTAKAEQLEERLQGVRGEIMEQRNAARATAQAKEQGIIAQARSEADTRVATAVDDIAQQSTVARRGLRDASTTLAGAIAGQVLGRSLEGSTES